MLQQSKNCCRNQLQGFDIVSDFASLLWSCLVGCWGMLECKRMSSDLMWALRQAPT